MATQTLQLATADEGRVQWQADYDDVSLLVTALRVTNSAQLGTAASRVWLVNDPTRRFPRDGSLHLTAPGQSEQLSVPSNQAARLQLTVSSHNGRLAVDNLDGEFVWPW